MKLAICGSRDLFVDSLFIDQLLELFNIGEEAGLPANFEVVSGGADGIDSCAAFYAHERYVFCKVFDADWNKHGRAAGPIRNKEIATYADALLLIHNGSPGSLSMKTEMLKLNKPVYEITLTTHHNAQNIR